MERRYASHTVQQAKLRRDTGCAGAIQRPARALLVALDVAPDGEAEDVVLGVVVAELREGTADRRRPAHRIDPRRNTPDAVPRIVPVGIVVHRIAALHADRIDGELEARAT